MEILVHESKQEAEGEIDPALQAEGTIRFTVKNLMFNSDHVKGPIFHVNSFPWCISVSRSSDNPDYIDVILYCEYNSDDGWECKGFYMWKTLNTGSTMEILVHDPDDDNGSESASRTEATIVFTIKNLAFNCSHLKGPIFYMTSFPWCISVTRVSTNPEYINVILYCEFVSTNPWECRGSYIWKLLNVHEAAASTEKLFKLSNTYVRESRSQVFVPSMYKDDIKLQLTMKITYHKYIWANPELKVSLDDIYRQIATNVKIAGNTEKLLEKQLKQSDHERQRIMELEQRVKYLEECCRENTNSYGSTTNASVMLGDAETQTVQQSEHSQSQHVKSQELSSERERRQLVVLERKAVELGLKVKRLEAQLAEKQHEVDAERVKSTSNEAATINELKQKLIEQEVELYAQKQANVLLLERLKVKSRDRLMDVESQSDTFC